MLLYRHTVLAFIVNLGKIIFLSLFPIVYNNYHFVHTDERMSLSVRLYLQIKLKKVLGLTVCSNAALDVSPTTGVLAYPAGYVLAFFHYVNILVNKPTRI